MGKRGTLDQGETDMHESGHKILPTQPYIGPGHVLHRAVNSQDVIKLSDGHRNVVIRLHTSVVYSKKFFYIIVRLKYMP